MWASAAAHLPRYLAQAARPPVARRASLRSDSGVAPATFSAIPSPFAVDTVARPGPPCPPLDVAALRFFFFFFAWGLRCPAAAYPPRNKGAAAPGPSAAGGSGGRQERQGQTRPEPRALVRRCPQPPPGRPQGVRAAPRFRRLRGKLETPAFPHKVC